MYRSRVQSENGNNRARDQDTFPFPDWTSVGSSASAFRNSLLDIYSCN